MNSSYPPISPPPRAPFHISPVLISIIGVLGSVFLLVGYYQLLLRYCFCFENILRRRFGDLQQGSGTDDEVSGTGLDQSLIAQIPIVKYSPRNADSGNECSVCLTEFSHGELVRVLPKCRHAFHVSCIGLWLNTHTNCPLCRANIEACLNCRHCPTAGHEIEPPRPPTPLGAADSAERALPRSFSYGGSSHLPPEGASSSQWYQRFRWSGRASSSPSREDMRSRLLDSDAKEDLESGVNLDRTLGLSNGGHRSSRATKPEFL